MSLAQEGEADRLYRKQRSQQQQYLIPQEQPEEPQLLPQDLADPDSQFTTIKAVSVHYKVVYPEVSVPGAQRECILCWQGRRIACISPPTFAWLLPPHSSTSFRCKLKPVRRSSKRCHAGFTLPRMRHSPLAPFWGWCLFLSIADEEHGRRNGLPCRQL